MRYSFRLTGVSPLLMHADNVIAADELEAWRKDPKNKSISKAGDDRSPAWTWQTYLYTDGEHLCLPSDALGVALRYAGAKMTMKKQESFKAATQSGILIDEERLILELPSGRVPLDRIARSRDLDFEGQLALAESLGFTLDVRRAVVGQSKHVRVRPRFESWSLSGTLQVTEAAITADVLEQLFQIAGDRAGLGDWRPSAKKSPGPYGRFKAKITPA